MPKEAIAQERCFPLFVFNLLLAGAVIITVKIEMLHDTCIIPKYKYRTRIVRELLAAV